MLIDATTADNLNPPSGVWDLSTWLYKAYAAHGTPQTFQTTMVEGPHGYNKEQREFAYAWMLKWLGGDASNFWEEEFPVEKKEDTWCTAQGNVYNESGSRRPHDLVLDYLQEHRFRPVTVRTQKDLTRHRNRLEDFVKEILFLKDMTEAPREDTRAPRQVAGLKLTPVILRPEKRIELPSVWIESPNGPASGPVIVYLNDAGKIKLSEENVVLRRLLNKGFRIFAVDLRGMGETAPDQKERFWDFLAGRPLFGQRVRDARTVVKYLSQKEGSSARIFIWAKGMSGIYSAFAAILEKVVIGMVLERPLLSFEEIVTSKVPAYKHEVIVPGILKKFDLPDVYQALCPIDIVLINPLAGDKSPVSKRIADDSYQRTAETYTALNKSDHWSVHTKVATDARADLLMSAFINTTGE
ncbi:MAG: hypothetical protein P8Z79_24225 [Sedimentisphaerales bacterium]